MIDRVDSEVISSREALLHLLFGVESWAMRTERLARLAQAARALLVAPLQDQEADERACAVQLRLLVEACLPGWYRGNGLMPDQARAIYEAVGHRDQLDARDAAQQQAAAVRTTRRSASSGTRHVRQHRRAAAHVVEQATAMAGGAA